MRGDRLSIAVLAGLAPLALPTGAHALEQANRRRRRSAVGALLPTLLAVSLAIAPSADARAGDFAQPATSPEAAGSNPFSVAQGDFNGDAKQDLATANGNSNNVTISLGDGAGDFSQPTTSPEAVGGTPFSVAVGDFNGDAKQDLATANFNSNDVTILLGDGAGDFSQPTTGPEAVGDSPVSAAVGDFNGDGKQDLATANVDSDDVTILLGDGAGDFSQPTTGPEAVGDSPSSVAVGDFNGDAKQDLATANGNSDDVTILLGDGAGDFSQPTTGPEAAGDVPSSVAVGDFNGDGKQDLATANLFSSDVTISLGDGTGDFSQPTTSPDAAGDNPSSVAVGDFNGDGKQDLATANGNSDDVTILLGDGAGDFSQPTTGPEAAGDSPVSAAVGDFDGDGFPDLATANVNSSDVTILLNRPEADLAVSKSDSSDPATQGRPLTYILRVANAGPDRATGVVVRDDLPSSVDFVSASSSQGSCTRSGGRVTCELGGLGAGASARVRIVVRPRRTGTVTNTARVEGRVSDPRAANDSSSQATKVRAVPRPPPAPGPCTITRGSGNDVIRGTAGRDVICAGAGNDIVYGGGGNDTIVAGAGNDIVYGGGGNDTIVAGAGNDIVRAGRGDDRLIGGSGRDILRGEGGGDSIHARDRVGRNDISNGGRGSDSCASDPRDIEQSC